WWVMRARTIEAFAARGHDVGAAMTVAIPTGSGPQKVAHLLAAAGVVTDADLLYAYLRRERLGPKLKAGEYEFSGMVTPKQVIARLVAGDVKTYHFTVPEGLRSDEVFPILARSELKLDPAKLRKLASDPAFLHKLGVPADRIEGFLFPDTYTFTRGATEEQVLAQMVSRALEEYRAADAERSPGNTLSMLEAFTLASIVEKETGAEEERPRISCVFHNRLRLRMKLQTDPTVLYAMSLLRGTWVNNITRQDLETPHPYNTYTTQGLPPGPIANPGAAALKAALHPIRCDDLYFVSQNNGTHVFCPDLKCHNAAVEKWQHQYFRQKRQQKGRTASSRG
ncbi:MAG: endolytic transglycosylase MltG, partial [Myxococcaceae bacterium]|nr:endolytic transglycosylase MltG [Myxococcaceae bacterium]